MKRLTLEIIATNGRRTVRLVWYKQTQRKAIYGSVFDAPGNLHFSYHQDGNIHTKIDPALRERIRGCISNERGCASCGFRGPPLDDFRGSSRFMSGGVRLDDECFDSFREYSRKPADHVLCIDNRRIGGEQRWLSYYFDLIEPGNYSASARLTKDIHKALVEAGKTTCSHHCFFHLDPWLIVHLAHCSLER